MRTFGDRIRHTVLFELIALVIVAVAGSWILGRSMATIGALGIMFSVMVMGWNLLYNWLFDHWHRIYRQSAKRTVMLRLAHAVLFELVILFAGVFLVAWWLDVSYLHALVLDIGFAVFFVGYAFAYNWAYDTVFPVPDNR